MCAGKTSRPLAHGRGPVGFGRKTGHQEVHASGLRQVSVCGFVCWVGGELSAS